MPPKKKRPSLDATDSNANAATPTDATTPTTSSFSSSSSSAQVAHASPKQATATASATTNTQDQAPSDSPSPSPSLPSSFSSSNLARGTQSAAVDAVMKQMDEDEKALQGKGVDQLPPSWANLESAPWTNVTDDGAVRKLVIAQGKGDVVPVMYRCYINVVGRLSNDSVFINYSHEESDFMTGHAQVPKGLEMAVVGMRVGEHALLRIAPSYGYSRTRKPDHIPIDAYLYLDVKIIRFEKERNLHEMNTEEKIYYCIKRRELGKELFTATKHRSALAQYGKALQVLETSMQKCEDRYMKDKNEQLLLNYVNVATCHFQIKEYAKSVEFCNKALRMDPTHVKALYRRAVCERLLSDWEESLRDYEKVIATCQDQSIVSKCQQDIVIVKKELATANAKQKQKLAGFFKDARGLYGDKSDEAPPPPPPPSTAQIPENIQQQAPTFDWRSAAKSGTAVDPFANPSQQQQEQQQQSSQQHHGHSHGSGEDHGHAHGPDGPEIPDQMHSPSPDGVGFFHSIISFFRGLCSRDKPKSE